MTDDVATAAAETPAVSEAPVEAAEAPAEAVTPEPQEPAEAPDKPSVSTRDALKRAFETVEKQSSEPAKVTDAPKAEEAEEAKPEAEAKAERERNPDGTFKAKEQGEAPAEDKPVEQSELKTFVEPPSRFSPDAKAAWKDAPEAVRAEITRAVGEMEQGLRQYQERWEPLRQFDEMARRSNTTLPAAMARFVGMEQMLARDPMQGLDHIARSLGTSLREVAEKITGQTPDENARQHEQTISDLRRHIDRLEGRFTQLNQTIENRDAQSVHNAVMEFSARPEFSRFDELSADIQFLLDGRLYEKVEQARQTGKFDPVLQEAYELAERLNPAPVPPAPAPAPQPVVQPQTQDKGRLSTSGAPSSGSNPTNKAVPATARDAVKRAFQQMGI